MLFSRLNLVWFDWIRLVHVRGAHCIICTCKFVFRCVHSCRMTIKIACPTCPFA
jgi:hypothetical protein